jgi:wobble nucleotide-excising tRNase
LDGKDYIDISDDCPYCISKIKAKKDVILKVGEIYDSKSIESQSKIIATFERLNKYFSGETKLKIDTFVKAINGFTDDQITFLKEIKGQIDLLSQKFTAAKNLGFSSLKDVEKVVESLKAHKIDIDLYNHLQSESTKSKVNIINESIDELLLKAGVLQGNINKQNILISRLVEEYNEEINEFLKSAGYKYKVALLADESGQHNLRLIHEDSHEALSDAKGHLSYGERNAISLVLFMYDAIKSDADFIVLDDPISSFDKNKKYAIRIMMTSAYRCWMRR